MSVKTEMYKNHTITIEYDDCPISPRDDDPLTEIHYHSNKYYLGDTNWKGQEEEYKDMLNKAKKQGDLVIPLYAYIHSGIALSLGQDFYGRLPQGHAAFDSGQCGVVILRKQKMLKEYQYKIFTKALKKRVTQYAKEEIKMFEAYLNGQIFGYIIDKHYNDLYEQSCWDYYSIEDALHDAKLIIDDMVKDVKVHSFPGSVKPLPSGGSSTGKGPISKYPREAP